MKGYFRNKDNSISWISYFYVPLKKIIITIIYETHVIVFGLHMYIKDIFNS